MKNNELKILAIETSCDETASAVVYGFSPTRPVQVLSSVVASSEKMHVKTGGIVPEVAAREQLRSIIPVLEKTIYDLRFKIQEIDAIAVTVGPGLIGSLLVGIETAKALAYTWEKPMVPVNHLVAHLYANFIGEKSKGKSQKSKLQIKTKNLPKFPALGLIVSGGHTELVLIKSHGSIKWLGGTRDDAAGECLDKCARLLGLGYPGGPAIAAEAERFKIYDLRFKNKIKLPRPLIYEDTLDLSFSGLKTAVLRMINEQKVMSNEKRSEIAYELQEAVVEVLVAKLEKAVKQFKPKSVLIGGGVAANLRLREQLKAKCQMLNAKLYIPSVKLCTDNAAAIGVAAYYNWSPLPWQKVVVDPGLELE